MNFIGVLTEILPPFNSEWEFEELAAESYQCYNYFQVKDNNGFYCGFIPFSCTIFFFKDKGFSLHDVKITKHIIDLIYADYRLSNGQLDDTAPFLDNLAEDIFKMINRELENYNENLRFEKSC